MAKTPFLSIFLSLAFALTAAAQTYPFSPHSHSPSPAYVGDIVSLNITVTSYNTCDFIERYSVSRLGNSVTLRLRFYEPIPGYYCAQVVTQSDQSFQIGTYPSGNYYVTVVDDKTSLVIGVYSFSVQNQYVCLPPSASQFAATNVTCSSVQLRVYVSNVSGYMYRYRIAGTNNWTSSLQTTSPIAPIGGLNSNTTYEFQTAIVCNGVSSGWSSSKYFVTCQNGNSNGTCSAPYILSCGTVYKGNNGSGTNTYSSYSGIVSSPEMNGPEVVHQLTLTTAGLVTLQLTGLSKDLDVYVLSDCNPNTVIAWGWNNDNTDEFVAMNLSAGTYRVVVDGWRGAISNYTLTVSCNVAPCIAPAKNQLVPNVVSPYLARVVCNYPTATAFDWQYRVAGSTTWLDVNGSSNNFYDFSGLKPSTVYEVRCAVLCASGIWSAWSDAQTFATLSLTPSNDDPCGAIELPLASGCVPTLVDNSLATASVYPAIPQCTNNNMKDLWYYVFIPSNGKVIIRTNPGTITDGMMAIYGGSCSSLYAGNPECFDDISQGTTTDLMPDITITGTPGQLVFIRVWGYGGATGDFYICATITSNNQDLTADGPVVDLSGNNDRSNGAETNGDAKSKAPKTGVEGKSLQVFPNPATDRVTLAADLAEGGEAAIRIFDVAGKLMLEETKMAEAGTFTTDLDIAHLPAGTFIVHLSVAGNNFVKRLSKQ